MSFVIQAKVEVEDILEAMSEDSHFALEMWEGLTDRLAKGQMLDDLGDILSGFVLDDRKKFMIIWLESFNLLKDLHLEESEL